MIYRSVRPVRAWSSPLVSAAFLTFAIAGGTFLAATIVTVLGREAPIVTFVAILATITAWAIKVTYWRAIDRPDPTSTRETALGLQGRGRVTPLEPAHSHPNYLLEEMGYVVARRHASKLRRIALAGAASALALLLTALAVGPGMIATPIVLLATGTYFAAVLIERWLFFAEARHTVLLYYGAG